jgi:hypothetical protein
MSFEALKMGFGALETDFEVSHSRVWHGFCWLRVFFH